MKVPATLYKNKIKIKTNVFCGVMKNQTGANFRKTKRCFSQETPETGYTNTGVANHRRSEVRINLDRHLWGLL